MADEFEGRVRRGLREQAAGAQRPQDPTGDVRRRVRRQDVTQRTFAGAAAVVALVVLTGLTLPTLGADNIVFDSGPASSPPDGAEADPPPTASIDPEYAATCKGQQDGVMWEVSYPESWWASDYTQHCRFLHPEPIKISDHTDPIETAISLRVTTLSHQKAIEDARTEEVLSERETSVDGRRATAVEFRLTTSGDRHGMRMYGYAIDLDDRTLLAVTSDREAEGDYEQRRALLDDMVASLEISVEDPDEVEDPGSQARCSAAELSPEPTPQPELPEAVAELRAQLIEAAVACDYEALAAIAVDAEHFNESFFIAPPDGTEGDARRAEFQEEAATAELLTHWRRAEAAGHGPLRFLVELLNRPHAVNEDAEPSLFVWPSAFPYERWDDVPTEDREALRPLYDDDAFEDFAAFGSYQGYRVGITADGEWSFFVAGD